MDESGFEAETIRPYGYTPIGKPCIDSYNWQAKKRTNVIGALYEKMLFALDYFEQNINSHIFYDWCKFTLIPSLKTKCVIVMDNARFHKNKRIQKLLNRHGHRILWLPPYSPDLNPIEKKWAQAKFLRQGWMENNLPKLFCDMGCISFIVNWLYLIFYFGENATKKPKGNSNYKPQNALELQESLTACIEDKYKKGIDVFVMDLSLEAS